MIAEPKSPAPGLGVIETGCVDDDATPFGTFQSHNRSSVYFFRMRGLSGDPGRSA